MGNELLCLRTIGVLLALGGCGGGQTGQPGEGGPEDCLFDTIPPLDCCRPVEADASIDGWSAREIVSARGSAEGVPVFWTDLATRGAAVHAVEAEQTRQTSLSLKVTLDETAPIQFCYENSLEIPVNVALATGDGFEAAFSSTWHWGGFFEAVPSGTLHAPAEAFPLPGSSAELRSNCSALFDFGRVDDETLQGRFCSAEQGLALFPTACGGLAQLPPSEAPPYPHFEAPEQTFAPFEGVNLVYEDLPSLTVSMNLSDPSACYADPELYHIDADFTFETDGVRFAAEGVHGFSRVQDVAVNEATGRGELGIHSEFEEHCGDVSESSVWQALPGSTARLCVLVVQTRYQGGKAQRFAEVLFEGRATGWLYYEP